MSDFNDEGVADLIARSNGGKHEFIMRGDMARVGVRDRYRATCICGSASGRADLTLSQAHEWFNVHKLEEMHHE